jgi:hypothetical protein
MLNQEAFGQTLVVSTFGGVVLPCILLLIKSMTLI